MFSQFAKFIISMVAESALVNLIQGKGIVSSFQP